MGGSMRVCLVSRGLLSELYVRSVNCGCKNIVCFGLVRALGGRMLCL
jgi:hypothetical protein